MKTKTILIVLTVYLLIGFSAHLWHEYKWAQNEERDNAIRYQSSLFSDYIYDKSSCSDTLINEGVDRAQDKTAEEYGFFIDWSSDPKPDLTESCSTLQSLYAQGKDMTDVVALESPKHDKMEVFSVTMLLRTFLWPFWLLGFGTG